MVGSNSSSFAFGAFGLALLTTLVLVNKVGRLKSRLRVSGDSDDDAQQRVQKALFSGEGHLRDIGASGAVWMIRGLYVVEMLCIFGVIYFLFFSGAA